MKPFASALHGPGTEPTPIVFVHGDGDSGALWQTIAWRFESNGWPAERLHAIDLPCPLARDDDRLPQQNRSSSHEQMQHLSAEIERVLALTGAPTLALVANSRGGFAVRHCLTQPGLARRVSHAVLGGTPNHGVWALAAIRPGSVFNGAGPFLTALNTPNANGLEVAADVQWMTLRSDRNDKYAQPLGTWIGAPDLPTHVGFDSPELRGATNLVLPGADHRETSFSPAAFAATWRFITGRPPDTLDIVAEPRPRLGGKVFGVDPFSGEVDNRPLEGATVEVFATDRTSGRRLGEAIYRGTVGSDGAWGPVDVAPSQPLEFVLIAKRHAITHIYRSAFARSSSLVHLQAERLPADVRGARSVVALSRPRGYFDRQRDRISLDGVAPPPDVPPGTASVSVAYAWIAQEADRAIAGEFNGERAVGRTWPVAGGHLVRLELHF